MCFIWMRNSFSIYAMLLSVVSFAIYEGMKCWLALTNFARVPCGLLRRARLRPTRRADGYTYAVIRFLRKCQHPP